MNGTLVAALCGVLASGIAMAESAEDVIAKMGHIEIKRGELEKLLGQADVTESRPNLQAVDQALRTELIRRALMEEAKRQAWDKRPEVQQQIERARDQVVVASFMNQQSRPAADYPNEQEIKQAYEANKDKFVQPPQVHLAQIYVSEQSGGSQAKADALWQQASAKGADFAGLARQQSKHESSAAQGGDMGWLPAAQLAPEIKAAVEKLAPGEIGKPVKASGGWHVLKLIARKGETQAPLSEVRQNLVNALRLAKAQENEQRYINELVKKTPITVNEIGLSSLVSKAKP